MGEVSNYASVTTLNEGGFLYISIDTDSDGSYESRKVSIATLRSSMYDTNSRTFEESKGSDLASGAALTIGTDGNYFDITGTTTIAGINTVKIGAVITVQFDAALTLTHHATDFILPGGEDISVVAGDHATFREYDTGLWRLTSYQVNLPITGAITPVYIDAAPQTLAGAGAIDITSPITNFESTGATDALTLVDSTVLGQIKVLNHQIDGGGYVLTPTTLSGGTTVTVTDVGVSLTFMWTATGWRLVGQVGVATIA